MIKKYFKKLLIRNKEFIREEIHEVDGLIHVLMKSRNTGERWTSEEISEIKAHLKNIAKVIPVLIIFLLPGGSLLLPFLVEVLDRRNTGRV